MFLGPNGMPKTVRMEISRAILESFIQHTFWCTDTSFFHWFTLSSNINKHVPYARQCSGHLKIPGWMQDTWVPALRTWGKEMGRGLLRCLTHTSCVQQVVYRCLGKGVGSTYPARGELSEKRGTDAEDSWSGVGGLRYILELFGGQ